MDSPGSLLEVLVRRRSVFQRLREGAAAKSSLVSDLGVSRSTVDRGLRQLEWNGLVRRDGDQYRLTLEGRLVARSFERFDSSLASIEEAIDVLEPLPSDAPLDPSMLIDAEIVRAPPSCPYRPVQRQIELLETADRADVIGTAVVPGYVEVYREQVVSGNVPVRALLPSAVISRLLADHSEALDEMLDTGRLTLRQGTDLPPYSLTVARQPGGPVATLVVYVPDGVHGVLVNDAPRAVDWARETFETHWEAADTVSMPR